MWTSKQKWWQRLGMLRAMRAKQYTKAQKEATLTIYADFFGQRRSYPNFSPISNMLPLGLSLPEEARKVPTMAKADPITQADKITFLQFRNGKTWRISPELVTGSSWITGSRIRQDGSYDDFMVPTEAVQYIITTLDTKKAHADSSHGENGAGKDLVHDDFGDSLG